MTLQSCALKNQGYPLLVLKSSPINNWGEEGKSGGRMNRFAREVGKVLRIFQYIKNFSKTCPNDSETHLQLPEPPAPGAEWSRPGAELSGKWHYPGLARVGRAEQVRAAGRQAIGGLETGEPCEGLLPGRPKAANHIYPKPPSPFYLCCPMPACG